MAKERAARIFWFAVIVVLGILTNLVAAHFKQVIVSVPLLAFTLIGFAWALDKSVER